MIIHAKFGAGTDMSIYHDGTDNHIDSALALNIATELVALVLL